MTMPSPIGEIVAGARRAAADAMTERLTDPLFGQRSPLSSVGEATPFFVEALNALDYPFFPSDTPFPFKSTPDLPVPDDAVTGEIVRADDAPVTTPLRILGGAA